MGRVRGVLKGGEFEISESAMLEEAAEANEEGVEEVVGLGDDGAE
jgi:hypothetical protein